MEEGVNIYLVGSLIKAIRKERGLSVESICEDICTIRYFYMIENESKIPSSEIIKKLNDRLEMNIFDYFDFIGFKKPLASKYYIEQSKKIRYQHDYNKMLELTNEMSDLSDSNKIPLSTEILSNQVILEIYVTHDLVQAFNLASEGLFNITGSRLDTVLNGTVKSFDVSVLSLLNIIFVINKMSGNETDANEILLYLKGQLGKFKNRKEYMSLYISVMLNYYLHMVFCDKVSISEKELKSFYDYQIENNYLERIFITNFLMSISCYYEDNHESAKCYFESFLKSGVGFGSSEQFDDLIRSLPEDYIKHMSANRQLIIKF